MAAIAARPLLIALLVLAFCAQTLATAAMHCRSEQPAPQQMHSMPLAGMEITHTEMDDMEMAMHEHHHGSHMMSSDVQSHHQADCCSTNGQCLMACSLALNNLALPLALKMTSPLIDNYRGLAQRGFVAFVYKPPIFA